VNRRVRLVTTPLAAACVLIVAVTYRAASAQPTGRAVFCKPVLDWVLPPPPAFAQTKVFPELAAPCPAGQVPSPIEHRGPKGLPGRGSNVQAPDGGVTYHYAGVYEYVAASGASMQWGQFTPTVPDTDSHSLAELAVETSDSEQIAEVGWTVDPEAEGDALPHLFVFHWVDGKATCYDGCGWEQVSRTRYPGMIVALTREPQEVIFQYMNSAWWVWYQSEWIGFFPLELWAQDFSSAGLIQWFGEVAGTQQPRSQMGDGVLGSQTNAAFMVNLQVEDPSNGSQTAFVSPDTITDPSIYQLAMTDAGFLFGGPGYQSAATCATCASLLANCGVVDDGCGSSLTCGICVAPETCGGGGLQENVCALPDGGMGQVAWAGGYFDAGTPDAGKADAGSGGIGPSGGASGCSTSGGGSALLLAALAFGLLLRLTQSGRDSTATSRARNGELPHGVLELDGDETQLGIAHVVGWRGSASPPQ
jgi:Neprosin